MGKYIILTMQAKEWLVPKNPIYSVEDIAHTDDNGYFTLFSEYWEEIKGEPVLYDDFCKQLIRAIKKALLSCDSVKVESAEILDKLLNNIFEYENKRSL
jgi:hypothetical protein